MEHFSRPVNLRMDEVTFILPPAERLPPQSPGVPLLSVGSQAAIVNEAALWPPPLKSDQVFIWCSIILFSWPLGSKSLSKLGSLQPESNRLSLPGKYVYFHIKRWSRFPTDNLELIYQSFTYILHQLLFALLRNKESWLQIAFLDTMLDWYMYISSSIKKT